jgi:hypothetical protein
MNVGDLKQLIANLPDDMPFQDIDGNSPIVFVADYADIPEEIRPPPTLVVEYNSGDSNVQHD